MAGCVLFVAAAAVALPAYMGLKFVSFLLTGGDPDAGIWIEPAPRPVTQANPEVRQWLVENKLEHLPIIQQVHRKLHQQIIL